MRLERLTLKRYGRFTDFSLDFGTLHSMEVTTDVPAQTESRADFHLLFGPNEAGKSTTLAAITDLFYGIKRLTPWNFLHENELLEIQATLHQGPQRVELRRFKNHLTNQSNSKLAAFPLDLQGLSRDDYTSRFSFDEQSLKEGGEQILSSQGDVGQALFSASSGLSDLTSRMAQAMHTANQFWLPGRKSNIHLSALKDALQANKQRMSDCRLDLKNWQLLNANLAHADAMRSAARNERSELQRQYRNLEKSRSAVSILNRWVHYRNKRDKTISLLPAFFTNKANTSLNLSDEQTIATEIHRIRQLIQNCRLNDTRLSEQRNQIENLQNNLKQYTLSEHEQRLVSATSRLASLNESVGAEQEWKLQLPEASHAAEHYAALIADSAKRLEIEDPYAIENTLPGDAELHELGALLDQEILLTERVSSTQENLMELGSPPEYIQGGANSAALAGHIDLANDVLHRIQREMLPQKKQSAKLACSSTSLLIEEIAAKTGIDRYSIASIEIPELNILDNKLAELATAQKNIDELSYRLTEKNKSITVLQLQSSQLAGQGLVGSTALAQSMLNRDQAWSVHLTHINDYQPQDILQESARQFEKRLSSHDSVIAQSLLYKEQSTKLQLIQSQLNDQQIESTVLSHDLDTARANYSQLNNAIVSRFTAIYPYSVIEPDRLRQRYTDARTLQGLVKEWNRQCAELEAIDEQYREYCQQLLQVLATLETDIDRLRKLDLPDLQVQAEKILSRRNAQMMQMRDNELSIRNYNHQLSILQQKHEDAKAAHMQWMENWQQRSAGRLFKDKTVVGARDAIPVIRTLREALLQYKEAQHRKEFLAEKIASRQTVIDELLNTLGLNSLEEATSAANAASLRASAWNELSEQLKTVEKAMANTLSSTKEERELLLALRTSSHCDSDEVLLEHLEMAREGRALETRCNEELANLRDTLASEVSEASAQELHSTLIADELISQASDIQNKLADAENACVAREREWALADAALNEIGGSAEYARLNQQRTTLLLELAEGARNTALARAGERVLKAAINRFRQDHQSTLLAEAKEAFTTLTNGRYINLVPREDGRGNEQLFAIDNLQHARTVQSLSTGTRYQLYLALRAAAHADYSRLRKPLPFVADDIMESFDDERAAAAFKVLGNMAMHGQVIYLTHHQHLIAIAQDALGSDNVNVHHY